MVPLPSQARHGTTPVPWQASQRARPPPDSHSPPLPPHWGQAVVSSPPHSGHTTFGPAVGQRTCAITMLTPRVPTGTCPGWSPSRSPGWLAPATPLLLRRALR